MKKICPSKICQIEIHVQDLEKSLAFYQEVFGWQRSPADLHDYLVLDVPASCPYGISLVPVGKSTQLGKTSNSRIVLYFACDEPEWFAEQAVKAGGRKRLGPKKLPGYGTIYQIEDPDGNRFGLYQAKPDQPPPSI